MAAERIGMEWECSNGDMDHAKGEIHKWRVNHLNSMIGGNK